MQSAASLKKQGIDIAEMLPGAESAITLVRSVPPALGAACDDAARAAFCSGADYHIDSVAYDLTRDIESYGFRSLMTIASSASHYDPMGLAPVNWQIGDKLFGAEVGKAWRFNTVFTRKKFPERPFAPATSASQFRLPTAYRRSADLTGQLKDYAKSVGADLVGVASAERIASIADQLKPFYDGQISLKAVDKAHPFREWEPQVSEVPLKVLTAADYIPNAKSVLVIGLRYHKKVVEFATKPPAEAVGPYAFQSYVTRWQGALMASKIVQKLRQLGYQAAMTADLMGLGSAIASPRGFIEDQFSNRFAAVAAGLGILNRAGRVVTRDFFASALSLSSRMPC